MPWKDDYFTSLDPGDPGGDYMRVRINVVRGKLTDFVVQLEVRTPWSEGEFVAVVHYDGSHGRAHRDLLDRDGCTVRKTWLPDHLTLNDALDRATGEIEDNWRRHRDDFLRRSR